VGQRVRGKDVRQTDLFEKRLDDVILLADLCEEILALADGIEE
jgi:hypothetical protein